MTISDDRMLAVYSDMPRTGLAIGYVVSLGDGELLFTTRRGPIHCVAPTSDGAFLVGYMGYGEFETVSYDRGGGVRCRWNSHGHFVICGHDIRVIELENQIPSRSRLARLLPDATVVRGDLLDGFYTSEPHLRSDGKVFFARQGTMMTADDLTIDERVPICPLDLAHDVFHTRVLPGINGVFTTWSAHQVSSAAPAPGVLRHTSALVHLAV